MELTVETILSLPFYVWKGYAVIKPEKIPGDHGYTFPVRRCRLVAKALGQPTAWPYIVHHEDEDKLNDQPWNLRVMRTGDHTALHHRGKVNSPETRAKMAVSKFGNQHGLGAKHSAESIERGAAKRRGLKRTPEQCARIAEGLRGKVRDYTPEYRAKLSESAKKRWVGRTTNLMSCSICGMPGKKKSSHNLPNHGRTAFDCSE